MGFNDVPAEHRGKKKIAIETGKLVMKLLKKGITPSRIITRKAMENAVAGVMATGGSTNAVLHLSLIHISEPTRPLSNADAVVC